MSPGLEVDGGAVEVHYLLSVSNRSVMPDSDCSIWLAQSR